MTDDDMLFFNKVFHHIPRQGPGHDPSTRKALGLVRPHLPGSPKVLDVGCGSGGTTLCLARAGVTGITAVDIDPAQLDRLTRAAREQGLARAVETMRCSMEELPFAPESLDLIWSEGALYSMGFERALAEMHTLVAPGGCLAATEVAWTTRDVPEEAARFWSEEYPAIGHRDELAPLARRLGWEVLDVFELPGRTAWWDNYYLPVRKRILEVRAEHAGNESMEQAMAMLEREIAIYEQYGECWNYVFLVVRKPPA